MPHIYSRCLFLFSQVQTDPSQTDPSETMPTRGKITNERLKAVLDRIYRRDPIRYKQIVVWVWRNQKAGWTDDAMALTCEMADPYLDYCPNWFAYLNKLLPKATGRENERKSQQYKNEIKEIADEFIAWAKLRKEKHDGEAN